MEWTKLLLDWYGENARDLPWRRTADPYAIWVSEVMLQQTRVAAVLPYYARWMAELPTVRALARVPDERLKKLWEGLGYYSRARNLKLAAQRIVSEHGGSLPGDFAALRALPGIGDYTAGAVASIAFGIAVPAVDGNVLRVMARFHDDARDITDLKTRRAVAERLEREMPKDDAGRFNAALMELGSTVCLPNGAPACERCPLAALCRARAAGTAELLPVRKQKKPRRIEEKTVFVLLDGADRPFVYRRGDTGLLAGLYQLPEAPGTLGAAAAAAQLTAWGARPEGELSVYAKKHVFTHIEWHMRVYALHVGQFDPPAGWRPLDGQTALPTAYRVCL